MGAAQFIGSLRRIARNPYLNTVSGVSRHLGWQLRRLAGAFPCELPLSSSVLIASSGQCGVSALVNTHGMYDYNNMQLIKTLLRHGGCFVDVGANIGAYTLVASESPAAQIVAFEPHPATFSRLQANVARNSRPNVELVCAAVGNQRGTIAITDTPGSSTTHITASDEPRSLTVQMLRLDDFLLDRGLHPTLIKIDVEGFEGEVLEGLGARIGDVQILLVEINGLGEQRAQGATSLTSMLRRSGFVGPLFYDSGTCSFSHHPVHEGEDPTFLNSQQIPALVAGFGFRVPASLRAAQ